MARETVRPIRVMRMIARLNVGGPAMHVVHLAKGLAPAFETRLLAGPVGPEEGDMAYFAEERGVEPVMVNALQRPLDPRSDLAALRFMRRQIRDFQPDVVHTHTAKAGALGRLAAILEGVPVIVHTYHGHVLGGSYFSPRVTAAYRSIERQLARGTDRLVALTNAQADEMSGKLGIAPREQFDVISLGLTLERFVDLDRAALRREVRAELGVADSTQVFAIVGRLVPVKNHELLFQAWRLAGMGQVGSELWIVGSGEREEPLRKMAAELGIADSVRWLGWRRDLDRIDAAVDSLLLTSHDEGTPVALIEGLSAGTPFISTDVGGIREVLERTGAPGVVVPPGDATALAAEIGRVATAPLEMTPALRQRVSDAFSVPQLCERVADLYYTALERKRPELFRP